jgi:flavin-binding protein dodecin
VGGDFSAVSIRNGDDTMRKADARHEPPRCSGEREAAPRGAGRRDDVAVTVEKALELIGTGDSVQDAVTEALDRARMTLEGITGFEVVRISGTVDDATTEYRVELRVWFVLRERMHG